MSSEKRSLMFWDTKQSDEWETIKYSSKLVDLAYLEKLQKKLIFQDPFYKQCDASVHEKYMSPVSSKKSTGGT